MLGGKRSYFAFRYVLPGYTFLASMLIINIQFFITQINVTSITFPNIVALFGIILGFLSLLSGSAIGFFISQFWYLVYNHYFKTHERLTKQRSHIRLKEIEGIEKYIEEIADRVSIMAYILTYIADEKITNYINRLNDVINSLASTLFAILSGLVIGYIFRLGIFQQTFIMYDVVIIFILVFFMVLLWLNLITVLKEHDSIARFVIIFYEKEIRNELKRARTSKP